MRLCGDELRNSQLTTAQTEGEWWVDLLAAQPQDPEFFRRWFDDAVRWGLCAIEQDWMLIYWFGVQVATARLSPTAGGVAVWAHIGGFVAGMVLIKVFENPRLVAERNTIRDQRHWVTA